ncbi:DUF4150 domain-containing protein [Archangium gephyra]|uniref:PAAR-like domain-containing protein n=1 Tax=Archangium gephyra TaxID=48 RepID=UPI0035D3DEF6
MGSEVFANGNEIACEAGDGKVVAAFPDVCMSPPPPPSGPVPVPYPNTSFSKDMKEGSKTVKIRGKPAMLRDQSYYKTSPLGNEAATRNFGGSAVTHTITGKAYFASWSMDVQFESKNVTRHVDLATSNHASYPGSTPPVGNLAKMTALALGRIKEEKCPCCGSKECPAAFKHGDEKQSLEDFYGMNDKDERGNLKAEARRRRDIYATMQAMKKVECTCEGRVFPSPPCDVFRPVQIKPIRKNAIEGKWGTPGIKEEYQKKFFKANPGIVERFVASNPKENDPEVLKVKGGFKKVNHLTPKLGGGCPDNPGNLYPNDLLCRACKKIDLQFGVWQKAESFTWKELFRGSGAKKRRLKDFMNKDYIFS